MKVVLLGTGSPRPCADRAQPAQLIEIAGQLFVVDCGDAVTLQLARSGHEVAQVQRIFLTHLHWDHVLGYAGLVWGGWSAGRPTLEVWGPPGTKAMHDLLFKTLHAGDVEWISNVGYARSAIESIRIHEIGEGMVYDRAGVTVTATRVKHTVETYAYRFSYLGRNVVFSGDTAKCDAIVRLSSGADLLVQDTCAVYSRLYGDERSRKIRDALIGFHASPAQAGEMAMQAGVKKLICTHLLPGADVDQVYKEAESEFIGEVIVGADLMEIRV
ncbi:MAG: MBL fold metallo-hydrolase [Burkholderiales bacterium]|nr:MBL fold metallo-hydrolase [Burkholderiales bacterium]